MSRDEQIEEIQAEIIRWGENADKTGNYRYNLSEHLVDNNYRKAEDVAREIFEEIERLTKNHGITYTQRVIAELKKKYIGKDTNVNTNTEGEG